jgi:uncharacterized protein (DUF3084 family)
MDKTLRSILWVLVGLVVLSSFSTAWFFLAKEKLYNEYTSLEELFKNTMEKLNSELAVANREKTELKTKLDAIEGQFKALESRHSGLKSEHESAVSERDSLKRELASIKNAKAFLEKRLKEMESDIFVAALLKEKVSLQVEVERLRNAMAPKEMEIEKLKGENLDRDVKLSKLQQEKDLAEQRLKDTERVAQILSSDLLKEKELSRGERSILDKTAMENNSLKAKIAELGEIAEEYNNLLVDKENMKAMISRLENSIALKDREIDRVKVALEEREGQGQGIRAEAYHRPEEVDLPPIVLNTQPQRTAKLTTPSLERIGEDSGVRGRVVTVNKEHNFVVIDLGRQNGIDIGTTFNVYRGEMLLGSIEVIQARDRIAAADIKDIKEGLTIEIDDVVVRR